MKLKIIEKWVFLGADPGWTFLKKIKHGAPQLHGPVCKKQIKKLRSVSVMISPDKFIGVGVTLAET